MERRTKDTLFYLYTKTDLLGKVEELTGEELGADEHSWEELKERLRYLLCANCVEYESQKLCHTCTKEILYAYDDFYEV